MSSADCSWWARRSEDVGIEGPGPVGCLDAACARDVWAWEMGRAGPKSSSDSCSETEFRGSAWESAVAAFIALL